MLANFSNEPLTIPKATILGVAEEASEALRVENSTTKSERFVFERSRHCPYK
jgi:hypothetical protein